MVNLTAGEDKIQIVLDDNEGSLGIPPAKRVVVNWEGTLAEALRKDNWRQEVGEEEGR